LIRFNTTPVDNPWYTPRSHIKDLVGYLFYNMGVYESGISDEDKKLKVPKLYVLNRLPKPELHDAIRQLRLEEWIDRFKLTGRLYNEDLLELFVRGLDTTHDIVSWSSGVDSLTGKTLFSGELPSEIEAEDEVVNTLMGAGSGDDEVYAKAMHVVIHENNEETLAREFVTTLLFSLSSPMLKERGMVDEYLMVRHRLEVLVDADWVPRIELLARTLPKELAALSLAFDYRHLLTAERFALSTWQLAEVLREA